MQVTEDLGVGGLERVIATLCKLMDRSRFEPSVLCLRETGPFADELTAAGIPVFLLGSPTDRGDYLAFRKVHRLLREQKIDVLHTHNTHAMLDGVLGSRLTGVQRIVHTDHARDFPDKLRYMVAEHVLSYLVYKMVGVSDHTTENLRRYEKIPLRKSVTIPNGIDPSAFTRPLDVAAKRRELGIEGDGPVIGLGARLTAQKGVIYLLQALPALVQRFPGLTVVIAGDGELRDELQRAAGELGVADHVRFAGIRLDLPDILRVLDVYVLPSVWEGLPMALLEAMAARCPVVATNVGGMPTAIRDGVSGILVEPRDPAALAQGIGALLADPDLRQRYGAEAQRTFAARYSAEVMTRKYERLYRGEELDAGPGLALAR